ncbi:MAG: hypothetical protein VB144_01740 [Clostridia bacterium]|nr:hypothetical protein [Clostridia bacterium]
MGHSIEVNRAATSRWAVAGLKAALDIRGCYGGPPRLPMLLLGDGDRAELERIIGRVCSRVSGGAV